MISPYRDWLVGWKPVGEENGISGNNFRDCLGSTTQSSNHGHKFRLLDLVLVI